MTTVTVDADALKAILDALNSTRSEKLNKLLSERTEPLGAIRVLSEQLCNATAASEMCHEHLVEQAGCVLIGGQTKSTFAGFQFNETHPIMADSSMRTILPLVWAKKVINEQLKTLLFNSDT